MSHAGYLRDFWDGPEDEVVALTRGLLALADLADTLAPPAALSRIEEELDGLCEGADRAILGVVARLCVRPRSMVREHLEPLRGAGLSETEVHDVVHVVACFSYMNALADGLGVGIEERKEAWATRLYGEDGVAAHLAWARR